MAWTSAAGGQWMVGWLLRQRGRTRLCLVGVKDLLGDVYVLWLLYIYMKGSQGSAAWQPFGKRLRLDSLWQLRPVAKWTCEYLLYSRYVQCSRSVRVVLVETCPLWNMNRGCRRHPSVCPRCVCVYRRRVLAGSSASASLAGRGAACGSAWLHWPDLGTPPTIWWAPRCPPRSGGRTDGWREDAPLPAAQTNAEKEKGKKNIWGWKRRVEVEGCNHSVNNIKTHNAIKTVFAGIRFRLDGVKLPGMIKELLSEER